MRTIALSATILVIVGWSAGPKAWAQNEQPDSKAGAGVGRAAPSADGVIVFGFDSVSMLIRGPDGRQRVEGKSGKLRLPAGEYVVESVDASSADSKGRRWMAGLSLAPENRVLTVTAGRDNVLRCGGPLILSVNRREDWGNVIAVMYDATQAHNVPDPDPRSIAFDLKLRDARGNSVYYVRTPEGKLPPPPVMRISDDKSRPLARRNFKYG